MRFWKRLNSCVLKCDMRPVEWLSDCIKYTLESGKQCSYKKLQKCMKCGNIEEVKQP